MRISVRETPLFGMELLRWKRERCAARLIGERLESSSTRRERFGRDGFLQERVRHILLMPVLLLHARVLRSWPPALSRLSSRRWSSGLALFAPCSHNRVNALTLIICSEREALVDD